MREPPIRICNAYKHRAHKKFWIDGKCPVCDDTSYTDSMTGGLSLHQIKVMRQTFFGKPKETEDHISPVSVERE